MMSRKEIAAMILDKVETWPPGGGMFAFDIADAILASLSSAPQVTDEAVEKALREWYGQPYREDGFPLKYMADMRRVLEQFAASAPPIATYNQSTQKEYNESFDKASSAPAVSGEPTEAMRLAFEQQPGNWFDKMRAALYAAPSAVEDAVKAEDEPDPDRLRDDRDERRRLEKEYPE